MWVYFWTRYSLICVSILSINKPCLDYCSLLGNLEISQLKTSFSFFKIILAILDPLYFYVNVRIGLLISPK